MSLKSTNTTTLAGTFYVDIDLPNTNGTFDILDFGTINYEFDIIPNDKNKQYVGGMPGAMTIKTYDAISTGDSMFDVLQNTLGNYSLDTFMNVPYANANVVLIPNGESNSENGYRFPFSVRFQDLDFDEKIRHLTIPLVPKRLSITPQQWESSFWSRNTQANGVRMQYLYPTNVFTGGSQGNVGTYNAYPVGDVIHDAVSQLDTGAGNQTLFDVTLLSQGYGNIFDFVNTKYISGNIYTWPTRSLIDQEINKADRNITGNTFTYAPMFLTFIDFTTLDLDILEKLDNAGTIYDKVATFAGLDGSIFGSAFNVNFYQNRRTNIHNVNISNSDMESLKFKHTPRDVDSVTIGMTRTNSADVYRSIYDTDSQTNALAYFPVSPNQALLYEAWKGQPDTVSLDFKSYFPNLNLGIIQDNAGEIISNGVYYHQITSDTGTSDLQLFFGRDQVWADQTFNSALVSYASALGIGLTNIPQYRIETTILGVDKIKPHQVIRFDETAPQRYWGKHFRPTSLSYDLKADRVRVTAYEIDTFEFTPPVPPPPQGDTNIKACENGNYMVSLVYATNASAEYVYTNDNGTYMVDSFNASNLVIDAESLTNGTAVNFANI